MQRAVESLIRQMAPQTTTAHNNHNFSVIRHATRLWWNNYIQNRWLSTTIIITAMLYERPFTSIKFVNLTPLLLAMNPQVHK